MGQILATPLHEGAIRTRLSACSHGLDKVDTSLVDATLSGLGNTRCPQRSSPVGVRCGTVLSGLKRHPLTPVSGVRLLTGDNDTDTAASTLRLTRPASLRH